MSNIEMYNKEEMDLKIFIFTLHMEETGNYNC